MGQGTQAFIQRPVGFRLRLGIFLLRVFRNGIGDAVVETAIEGPKLIYPYQGAAFESQIRYRLTQIAVVVDNLVNGKSSFQQLAPVQRGG